MSFLSVDATAAGFRVLGENKSVVIHLTGQITAHDYHRLDALIEQIERRNKGVEITLILDSPGGAHFAALRAGLLVQRKGIGTKVLTGAKCLCACASIFFGGHSRKTGKPNRVAHEGSLVGVHRMTHVSGPWSEHHERRVREAAINDLSDVRVSEAGAATTRTYHTADSRSAER